jgi:outer membrane protein assembly factor BamB
MIARWLLLATLCTTLVACGGIRERAERIFGDDSDDVDPPAALTDFEPQLTIKQRWAEGVGAGTDEQYLKIVPAADDTRAYSAERKGRVVAVDVETGRQLWKTNTRIRISGGPGLGEGLVLVGSSDGEVVALDAETGKERWRSELTSEVLAPPRAADGIAVVRTGDGKLFGLSADSGARLWVYDRTVPVLTLRGTSTPVLVEDLVLAGFDSGRLVAVELLTGRLVWESQVAIPRGRSDLDRMVDLDGEPVVMGRSVYVATYQGSVAAVSLDTGDVEWSRDISSAKGLAVDRSAVYITDDESEVWALERSSGTSLWKQQALRRRALTAAASDGEYLVLGDFEGYVHWLSKLDGSIAARLRVDKSPIIVPPLVTANGLYIYASSGKLVAIDEPGSE